jgi:hypothetical protein
MALDKEKVQDLIDDFVINNVEQINDVATENPVLYDAVIDALNLLSKKFGTLQSVNVPKPAAPKANALNPIVQEGAVFIIYDIKENETKVEKINFEEEIVTFTRLDNQSPIKLKFSVVNAAIEKGDIKLVETPKANTPKLNPLVEIGAKFASEKTIFIILNIYFVNEEVNVTIEGSSSTADISFAKVNNNIESGAWVPVAQPNTLKLNTLVDIGEIFEKTNGDIITIRDIDTDKNVVEYDSAIMGPNTFASFRVVNDFIDQGVWVYNPLPQSNTFGALTLNPSIQVGQKYIDLDDDSNFSVLQIDQKKQVVTINWNEDDIEAEVDFEDFNDNLEAATWVLAPDQTQGAATEAEILEAIEGLELIGDAESKKEITELKKQLKQLKKKKP